MVQVVGISEEGSAGLEEEGDGRPRADTCGRTGLAVGAGRWRDALWSAWGSAGGRVKMHPPSI